MFNGAGVVTVIEEVTINRMSPVPSSLELALRHSKLY
jgi:hypothetical protein